MVLLESSALLLNAPGEVSHPTITMASSKSISNRASIIDALTGFQCRLSNLSEARDTHIMQAALHSEDQVLDIKDAGTTMRFLTAYFALSDQRKTLTGTARMQERPIGLLASALQKLGAEVKFEGNTGYPPISLMGFTQQKAQELSIPGNVSSQYLSALLMMAPTLPNGMKLRIEGTLMSKPYLMMTLRLMEHFGVGHKWEEQTIVVAPQNYSPNELTIESDWSSASYWYSMVGLSGGTVTLNGLFDQSLQGDRKIADIMAKLGVTSKFSQEGVTISAIKPQTNNLEADFSDCPDLAQTVLSYCAAQGITCKLTGLESLRIKETDRILALQQELAKIGAKLLEHQGVWELIPGSLPQQQVSFHSYEDHRMAMALAPLAFKFPVMIEDPKVVRKSYPGYWSDLQKLGITISAIA